MPETILAIGGFGFSAIGMSLHRAFPKAPRYIDILVFVFGVALLGAAALAWFFNVFSGHKLEWTAASGNRITVAVGDSIAVAIIFGSVILGAAFLAAVFTARIVNVNQPQVAVVSDSTLSGKTAEQILNFINNIRTQTQKSPIKIVSTEGRVPMAKVMVKALQNAGFDLLENSANADYIFRAKRKYDDNKTSMRFRENNPCGLHLIFSLIYMSEPCEFEAFPQSETYNYVQLEFGGSL